MSQGGVKWDDITTENKDDLEMEMAIAKASKGNKVKEEIKRRAGGGLEQDMKRQAQAAEKALKEHEKELKKRAKVTKTDVNHLYQAMDKDKNKKEEKQRANGLVKIRLYRELLPQHCKDVPKISASASLEQINGVLDGIRANCALKSLRPQSVIAAKGLARGMEVLQKNLLEQKIDPLGLGDITGLAELIERHPKLLESELTEVSIELNGLLRQNCYVRLAMKMMAISMLLKGGKPPQDAAADGTEVDPMSELAKKFADL